jgi:hypothetical protein
MHYSNLVVVPDDGRDPKEHVDRILEPHNEELDGGGGWWDWYQVGGRWTGLLVPGYDPEKDPRNIKTCRLCNGTGKRTDVQVPDGCNLCHGTGKAVEWPTKWERFEGDVQPIEWVSEEVYSTRVYRVVEPDGSYSEETDKPSLGELKARYPGHLVVVVDNHS